MTQQNEKYFYLLSLTADQLPAELNEFGMEQIVISSDGFYSDIEAVGALNKTLENLNSEDVMYKFNSAEYPVREEDKFEDNSFIELGDNFLKLLILATDGEVVSTSNLIGKVFSIISHDEYVAEKDSLRESSNHVLH